MKLSRLLTYGAAGIIGGLLFENRYLLTKMNAKDEVNKLKNKVRKMTTHK